MDIINKNVSIWRGDTTPPTQYHLWQKGDVLFHHNGLEWVENKVPVASSEQNGLMSKEDKDKLDNLVCDSLESDREDLALSAKQGKILLGKITDLNLSEHSQLTLRVSPTIIEQGVDTPITIQWGFKLNDASMDPDTIRVLENSSEISTDTSTKVISRSINSTTNYVVQASLKGVTKVQQTTVNAYYPMYFGSSSLDQITDVTTLTKQALKASPSGTYNISVNENEYIWWCIPNTMTINSIKSGGFEVPIEAPIALGNYKCYRTSSRLKAGIINCVIS